MCILQYCNSLLGTKFRQAALGEAGDCVACIHELIEVFWQLHYVFQGSLVEMTTAVLKATVQKPYAN